MEVQYQCNTGKISSGDSNGTPIREVIGWPSDKRRLNATHFDGAATSRRTTISPLATASSILPIKEVIPRDSAASIAGSAAATPSSTPQLRASTTATSSHHHQQSHGQREPITTKRPAIIAPLTQLHRTSSTAAPVVIITSSAAPPPPGWHNERFYPVAAAHPTTSRPAIAPPTHTRVETTTRDFWIEFKNNILTKEAAAGVDVASSAAPKSNSIDGLSSPPSAHAFPALTRPTTTKDAPLGSTSTSLQGPPALLGEQETYKMLLVIISCLVAVIFSCLTLGLLIACR